MPEPFAGRHGISKAAAVESDGPPISRMGSAYGAMILLSSVFGVIYMCRITFGPLLPTIEADLGLSHAAAGSLFLVCAMGSLTATITCGFVSAHVSHRRVIIATTLLLAGVMFGLSQVRNLFWLRVGMFIIGLVGGFYFPSAVATITTLLSHRLWARGLAIHDIAPSLALVAAPLVVETLLVWTDWQGVLLAIGGLNLALGLWYLRFGRGGQFTGRKPDLTVLRELVSQPVIWAMVILCSLGSSSSQGVFNILPLYLMDVVGLDRSQANLILAASRALPVISLFFVGWLADAMGHRRAVVISMLLCGLSTVGIGLGSGKVLMISIFAQPVIASLFFPALFALMSAVADGRTRNLVVSLIGAGAMVFGLGVVPQVMGWLGDHGLFTWGMTGLGALMIAGTALGPLLRTED